MCMEDLSPAKQRLLRLFQAINFGRVEELEIRDGEPEFSPAPRVFVELKLDANDGPRPESRRWRSTPAAPNKCNETWPWRVRTSRMPSGPQ